MSFTVELDCPLFTLTFTTDAPPTPDVLDTACTRLNRAFADALANVTPHANIILGDDEDDD